MTSMLLMMMLACSGGTEASTEPEAIAALANQVAANPDGADGILEAAGHTRESFDDALYEIAMDPEKSKRYLDAR
jgi:hypothetical protein